MQANIVLGKQVIAIHKCMKISLMKKQFLELDRFFQTFTWFSIEWIDPMYFHCCLSCSQFHGSDASLRQKEQDYLIGIWRMEEWLTNPFGFDHFFL
jgi:hypothetical protein